MRLSALAASVWLFVQFPLRFLVNTSVFPALPDHRSLNCGNEPTCSWVTIWGGGSQNVWQHQKVSEYGADKIQLIIKHVIKLKCFWKHLCHAGCIVQCPCSLGAECTAGTLRAACILSSAHVLCLKHLHWGCRLLWVMNCSVFDWPYKSIRSYDLTGGIKAF